mmetsp:Transcript_22426/g.29345  ORF Transcript_22426/g.29345 Transcript_22426/m.29345 type:complete len:373 (+) Transcript_22426:33-1151(+)
MKTIFHFIYTSAKVHVRHSLLFLVLLFFGTFQVTKCLLQIDIHQLNGQRTIASIVQMKASLTDESLSQVELEARLLKSNQEQLVMKSQEEQEKARIAANDGYTLEFLNDDHTGFGAVVVEDGVARIDNIMTKDTAQSLLTYVNQKLIDSLEKVATFQDYRGNLFGNVLAKKSRHDLLLPLEESREMIQALDELIGDGGVLGSIVDATLGKDAELYELGALISDPGSERQEIHPDIEYQEALIPLLTCFVALQDITESMGPTTFLPQTHKSLEDHNKLNGGQAIRNKFLNDAPSVLSTLKCGDCSIFNPCTMHAGGSNQSDQRRVLFYITFRNIAFDDPSTGYNPGSIRPELKKRRISIEGMRQILKEANALF